MFFHKNRLEEFLQRPRQADPSRIQALFERPMLANFKGEPRQAYDLLVRLRSLVEGDNRTALKWLFTIKLLGRKTNRSAIGA